MRSLMLFLSFLCACSLPTAEIPTLPNKATKPVRITSTIFNTFKCSGVAIHKNWALTAAHCADDDIHIEDLNINFMSIPYPEWNMLIIYAPGLDSNGNVEWVTHKPEIGDEAVLVGWGCDETRRKASITKARLIEIDGNDLYYDKMNCSGDSGGPVYDLDGRLIGLMIRHVLRDKTTVVQYLAE